MEFPEIAQLSLVEFIIDFDRVLSSITTIISVVSLYMAIRVYSRQKKYSKIQNNLNEILLEKEKKEKYSLNDANINIYVDCLLKHYSIVIQNNGKSIANDLNIEIPDDSNWIIHNDTFPLKTMNVNQEVRIPFSIYKQSKRILEVKAKWCDKNGCKENYYILTI